MRETGAGQQEAHLHGSCVMKKNGEETGVGGGEEGVGGGEEEE